nr:hypothetical protein [Tanacetum cinerariifolium]
MELAVYEGKVKGGVTLACLDAGVRKVTDEQYLGITPTYTGNFMPPKTDLILADVDEYVVSESVTSVPAVATNKAKTSESKSKFVSKPLIRDWVSDSENENETKTKSKQRKPSFAKVEFVKSNEKVKSPRESVKHKEHNSQAQHPRKNSQSPRVLMRSGFKTLNTARQNSSRAVVRVNTTRQINTTYTRPTVNSARPKAILNVVQGNQVNVVKASACWKQKHKVLDHVSRNNGASLTLKKFDYANLQFELQETRVIDSECSRHMTGYMSYLFEYEEINGGYIAFEGDPKGGKITDFKLLDESQVLLRVPRKKNMYNVDLKNVAPSGGLTCLFVKATLDESNLWHRRLGHINFKTMNNLEGKEHKASYDFSRFSWVFFLATENETSRILKAFITGIENLIDHKVKIIRCDNGTEFKNKEMNLFYEKQDHIGKFDRKANEGFFVGYSVNSKALRVFNSRTRIVEETLHITFLENKPNVPGSGPTWLIDIDTLTKSMNYKPIVARNQSNGSAGKARVETVPEKDYILLPLWTQDPLFSSSSKDSPGDGFKPSGRRKRRQVWTLVDLPNGKRTIETKWIYRKKKDKRVIVVRSKARLVAQGYTQEERIDYDEVFAPVARIEAIRLLLAYASFKDSFMYQMDVKSAFMYCKIEKEFMSINPREMCIEFEKMMHKKFQMSFIGELTFFLVLQVIQKDDGIFISQDKPDIMFVVCACARSQVTPKVSHLHAMKRIFRYLQGQPKLGFWYPKDLPFNLEAYTNSDYAGASLDRKSTTGGCQFLRSRLISWQCKKQTIVSNSNAKVDGLYTNDDWNEVKQLLRMELRLTLAYTYYCQLKVNAVRYKLTTVVAVNAIEVWGYYNGQEHQWRGIDTLQGGWKEDEAVYEEMYDRVERGATTATGLDAEQDRGIISKTQFTTTLNEPSSIETSSGSGPRRQETMGDTAAQTRSERVSKFSNDQPLFRVNTLGSGEDRLQLKELMELCIKLSDRVFDLEKTKTAQTKEIANLKKRVKRLERKKKSRSHGLKRLYKVRLTARVESSAKEESFGEEESSKQGRIEDIDADDKVKRLMLIGIYKVIEDVTTINIEEIVSTAAAITTAVTNDELTMAQALVKIKKSKPKGATTTTTTTTTDTIPTPDSTRPKARGVVMQEPSETPTTTTILKSSKVQDKGNGIIVEEPLKMKKKDQISFSKKLEDYKLSLMNKISLQKKKLS